MSILIKGMEMPDKATTIVVFPEGKARVFRQDIDHDEWLTVIEAPKHGRLIDADAVMSKYYDWFYSYDGERTYENMFYRLLTIIKDAPTIIAEDGT